MHELAICQDLLSQVRRIAGQRNATAVHAIKLRVGPLSGVEPPLLRQAFSIARGGTVAEQADLEIEFAPVTVHCANCEIETPAAPNRLLCEKCSGWQVTVTGGQEMILMSVELSGIPAADPDRRIQEENPTHV